MFTKLKFLLLCMALAASVCGCSFFAQDKNGEVIAEGLVASYFDDLISGSLGDYDTYFEEDDDLRKMYNRVKEPTGGEIELADSLKSAIGSVNAQKLHEYEIAFTQKLYANSDYVIESVRADDDYGEADVFVKFITPSQKGLDDAVSKLDITALLTQAFEFDINDPDAFMAALSEREGLEIDALKNKYSAMTENEVASSVMEMFSDELDAFVSLFSDEVIKILPKDEVRMEFNVEKQLDGEWKISDVD